MIRQRRIGKFDGLLGEAGRLQSFGVDFINRSTDSIAKLTFTRASSGTYFDSAGTLQTAGTNVASFDHNPLTLASLGLAIWEARTNSLLYGRDWTQAATWIAVTMTTALTATGIDGTANSATTLTAAAGNATILQTLVLAAVARSFSVYMKRRTGTGTVNITRDGGTSWTDVTSQLSTTAWARVKIENTSVLNPVIGVQLVTNTDAVDVDYAQDEAGAFITSAILTTVAAATRAADVCSTTDLSWFNAAEGTFVITAYTTGTTSASLATISDGTTNNRISMSNGASNAVFNPFISTGGVTQGTLTVGSIFASAINKLVVAYKNNDCASGANGAAIVLDSTTPGGLPVVTTLYVGGGSTGASTGAKWIASLAYYPRRLSDATLQMLSA